MFANSQSRPQQIVKSALSFILHPSLFILLLLPALSRWWLAQLPAGADTAIHFYRAVQLDWLIRNGVFYSRWLPDLVFGYGYPLFNYYGPLTYYLIVVIHLLGLPFIPATLAVFALADLLGAFGAYLLARDTLGKLPGLVTALAYAYAPYMLASLYRGTLAEALCWGLLPWLLWAFYRLWQRPTPRRFVFAALSLALFPLLNNPASALAIPTLLAFVAALAASQSGWQNPNDAARLLPIAVCFLLGLALSAFTWLPLLTELQFVQIERAYAPAVTNFRNNFLSLAQLLAWPQPLDPNLIGTNVAYGLGLPQVALALISLFTFHRRPREQKILLGLAAFVIPVLIFLTLPQSIKVWETVPGLSLIQFPARLLGPASLLLALLAGSVADFRSFRNFGSLGIAAIILFGFGWLYTGTDRSIPAQPTLADIHVYEHRTGVVGTTTATEYLPKWVQERPPDNSLDYTNPPINRFVPLPNVKIISETPSPLTQQVELDSPTDFVAVFNLFYFPGWAARVDGQPVTVTPTPVNGLASFPVPAGRHTLTLQFTDTPPRTVGTLISLAALTLTLIVAFWAPSPIGVGSMGESRGGGKDGLPRTQWVALAGVGLALMGVKLFIADRADSLFLQNKLKDIQHPLSVTFGDQLELLGYDDDGALYWRALQPLSEDWSVALTLDYEGHQVAQDDAQHPAGLPTSRWFTDQYARDVHVLKPIPGTPPGAYDLRVTVYRQSDGVVLQPARAKIGEWQVGRPEQPATLTPRIPAKINFGPLTLLGVDAVAQVGVGDQLPLTFYWEATATTAQNFSAIVFLLDAQDQIVLAQKMPPTRSDFGTSFWQIGDRWIGFGELPIPADLPGGQYTLAIGGLSIPIKISSVQVVAPDRVFVAPSIPHPLTVQFGEGIKLLGWNYTNNQFTLYWQSLTFSGTTRYTVFVHALDSSGNILAQRDSPPVNGTRPTTSWLPPEIITDTYDLTLPAGTTAIRIGLYDPRTHQRLITTLGEEFVIIQP